MGFMDGIMEVVYRRSDGVVVRTLAYYSHRNGPIGEWMVGNASLSELGGNILYKGPRLTEANFRSLVERHAISSSPAPGSSPASCKAQ